jgi:putative flippase GtrA
LARLRANYGKDKAVNTLLRYLVVAAIAYVIDMGGYYVLVSLNTHPINANIIVKVVAAICGFFMHRRFTYKITDADGKIVHATKYFASALVYTPVSTLVLFLLMLVLPHPVYAKAIADILLFVLTFWITSKFTFKRNEEPTVELKNSSNRSHWNSK